MKQVVLDASVGVKWILEEAGSAEALDLLRGHAVGELQVVVSSHFCYEFLAVAARRLGPAGAASAWSDFGAAGIGIVEIGDALVTAAIEQTETLGCSFYDSVAPALARLLDAPLYSADRQSHSEVPGVVLIG